MAAQMTVQERIAARNRAQTQAQAQQAWSPAPPMPTWSPPPPPQPVWTPPPWQPRPSAHRDGKIAALIVGAIVAGLVVVGAIGSALAGDEVDVTSASTPVELATSTDSAEEIADIQAVLSGLMAITEDMEAAGPALDVPAMGDACARMVVAAADAKNLPWPAGVGGASSFDAAMSSYVTAGRLCAQATAGGTLLSLDADLLTSATQHLTEGTSFLAQATAAL